MALKKTQKHHHNKHVPVLLDWVVQLLNPQPDESYLDLTAGYGGHATAILERTDAPHKMILVDRDDAAITALEPLRSRGVTVVRSDFVSYLRKLAASSMRFDCIIFDLGVSSPHLDSSERGFSFMQDGPLDMRMDRRQELTAERVVNLWSERDLYHALKEYGEERYAKQIAHAIAMKRPLHSTLQLAETVSQAVGGRKGRIHPATKTFQALRIVVNNELRQIELGLIMALELLNPGGRLAVISFHSLEDRIVKQTLVRVADPFDYEAKYRLLTKRPVRGAIHDVHNPRARSAMLRAVVKINNTRKGQTHAN